MDNKDVNPEDLFHYANELPTDVYGRAKNDLLGMLKRILQMGKEYRKENEGVKAHIRLGPFEASYETIPQPVSSRGSSWRSKPKALNLVGAQGVVAEYPDYLNQPEDAGEFWFIGTKKRLDDKYNDVNKKLRDNGFAYEKYVQGTPHTGGWRAKK